MEMDLIKETEAKINVEKKIDELTKALEELIEEQGIIKVVNEYDGIVYGLKLIEE